MDDPFGFPEHAPSQHTAQTEGDAVSEQSGWPPPPAGDSETPGSEHDCSIAEKKEALLYAKEVMLGRLDDVVRCVQIRA